MVLVGRGCLNKKKTKIEKGREEREREKIGMCQIYINPSSLAMSIINDH
jgi:hypothetical protein